MTTLPGAFFFGGLIASAIAVYYFGRWTWFARIHGVARWWVNLYLSFILLVGFAFALSFVSFTLSGYKTFQLMAADPEGGFAFYTEAGLEAAPLALVVLLLGIVVREIDAFKAWRSSSDMRSPWRRRLDLLVGLALLTSPVALFVGIDSQVKETAYFMFAPWMVTIPAIALAFALNWVWENPSARLHNNLGVQRLALVSMAHGLIWLAFLFEDFAGHARNSLEGIGGLGGVLLVAVSISLATWAAVNLLGWVWDGFNKKSSEEP